MTSMKTLAKNMILLSIFFLMLIQQNAGFNFDMHKFRFKMALWSPVIDTIKFLEVEKILDRVKQIELSLKLEISKNPIVETVRGSGLLIGIVLKEPIAKKYVGDLQKLGILTNATSETVIRIAPPLIVSDNQVGYFIETFRKVALTYER